MVDAEQTRRDHDEAHRYAAGYLVSPRERKVGRALRFATDPFEEESLSGLLARATAFHVLLHTNGVLRRAGLNMKTAGQLALLPPERLKPLAGIIGCTLDDITARSFTRTHSDRKVSDVRIGDATIRMFDLETTRRRIAPGTLRTHPFHRMAWMMRLLPYCEVSHELLRSDCSECARPLRWKDSCGVGVCESCEAEVRPSAEPPLTEGDRENYSIFADLLSANPRRHRDTLSRLSPPLRNLDHNTLVEMVLGVGARVVAAERPEKEINRKAIHRLPPEYLGAVIARGIGMMRNWPDDLRTWVRERAETLRNDRHAFLTHRAELRLLGARSRVSPAQATVMREALGDLFAKEHRSFAAPQTTALRFEASAILGTTNETLAELVELGHLSEGSIPGRTRDHVRYSMVELNEIRRALTESRTWPEIARSIGIPLYGMEQLCCTEKLDREMNAAAQYLRGAWGITTASRDTLWSDIRRNATEGIRPHGATPLGTAVRRIGGRLKPWGAIFDALSGSASQPSPFRFWISAENTTAWTRRIQVCPHDLKRFDDVAFESEVYATLDFSETTNITGAREILNLAGIPNCDLRKLFADDIASRPQFGPEKAVGLGVVLEEAKRSISVAEICERNRWSPRRLKGQVLRFASARTATGWKRDVIEGSGLLVS